jgi:hypothetical protein
MMKKWHLVRPAGWGLAVILSWGAVWQPAVSSAQWGQDRAALRPAYDQWTTYLNQRFSFEVPVPPGLRAQSDPRRGSSCRFATDDGAFVIRAWGSSLGPQPGDPLEEAWRSSVNQRGRRIDFQRRGNTGFVLTGVNREGAAFFEKIILGNGAVAGINLSYPAALVARFAPWVDEVERGFGFHPEAAAMRRDGGPPPPNWEAGAEVPPADLLGPDAAPPAVSPGDPRQPRVDLTPPPESPAVGPLEKPGPPAPQPAPAKREDLPYGLPITGKKGYVYSPYGETRQQVDVTDIPTGTKVKCPYTGKVFRVP